MHLAKANRLAAGAALLLPVLLLALVPMPSAAGAEADVLLARGDAAWDLRAEGHDGNGRAQPEPIEAAIESYAQAVDEDPGRLEAHWKLVRALYFAGEFATDAEPARRALFDRAAAAATAALTALEGAHAGVDAERLDAQLAAGAFAPGLRAEAARLYFWSAIAWGAWSQGHGLLGAVREGVAGRLRRYAEAVVALEPELEHGGAHRMLARLHATLPRVPFLTGWVDRERAWVELERAAAIAPDFPGNRLLRALTLLELAPERREEARALLEKVASLEPDPAELVEQLAMRKAARERLEALGDKAGSAGA